MEVLAARRDPTIDDGAAAFSSGSGEAKVDFQFGIHGVAQHRVGHLYLAAAAARCDGLCNWPVVILFFVVGIPIQLTNVAADVNLNGEAPVRGDRSVWPSQQQRRVALVVVTLDAYVCGYVNSSRQGNNN